LTFVSNKISNKNIEKNLHKITNTAPTINKVVMGTCKNQNEKRHDSSMDSPVAKPFNNVSAYLSKKK
jgi:hypothetical protein